MRIKDGCFATLVLQGNQSENSRLKRLFGFCDMEKTLIYPPMPDTEKRIEKDFFARKESFFYFLCINWLEFRGICAILSSIFCLLKRQCSYAKEQDMQVRLMNTELIRMDQEKIDSVAVQRAGEILRNGGLVGFPTETVYGLGGNGLNPSSAKAIYAAKGRPSDNPLILHIADRDELYSLVADIPEVADKLMDAFWPGPMTLIFPKSELVPKESTGGLDTVAIRMPSHPIAVALIRAAGVPIAAPSANRSGRPSPTLASHVWEDMDGRIEMILDGGEVGIGLESTIIDLTGEVPTILRPGYITQTMIEDVVGHTEVDRASTGENSEHARPKAPGMKYRHYAPQAEMTLVSGEPENVHRTISVRASEGVSSGKKVRIICTEETRGLFDGLDTVSVGYRSHPEMIAHNLFRVLREADRDGIEILLSETFEETELGASVMNRLMKAAGYHIIYV